MSSVLFCAVANLQGSQLPPTPPSDNMPALMDDQHADIAAALSRTRERTGMTQGQAAEAAGVSLRTIQEWEAANGLRSVAALGRLLSAYRARSTDVSADEVLGLAIRELPAGKVLLDQAAVDQIRRLVAAGRRDEVSAGKLLNWSPPVVLVAIEIPEKARVVNRDEAEAVQEQCERDLWKIAPESVRKWLRSVGYKPDGEGSQS